MPDNPLSGSQLEKLGDRLREARTLDDLRQLVEFIESLQPFAHDTYERIRALAAEAPGLTTAQISRRANKTTRSIVAKLRRQTTKLGQIQDLVGCRIVVGDIIDQDRWSEALTQAFPAAQTIDRRAFPQHGYRAVHVIVRKGIQRYEIQLRTRLQDQWANFVEKISDHLGTELKYGIGDPTILSNLDAASLGFAEVESIQRSFEARTSDPRYRFGKFFIGTYLPDYRHALTEIYPEAKQRADKEEWEAAHRLTGSEKFQRSRSEGGVSASDIFELSREFRKAWDSAIEAASLSLRLVLWSSMELPVGFELMVGRESDSAAESINVLGEIPIADPRRDLGSPGVYDLNHGRVYEITQPVTTERFLLSPDWGSGLDDMLTDAQVPILNIAAKLGLREYLE